MSVRAVNGEMERLIAEMIPVLYNVEQKLTAAADLYFDRVGRLR